MFADSQIEGDNEAANAVARMIDVSHDCCDQVKVISPGQAEFKLAQGEFANLGLSSPCAFTYHSLLLPSIAGNAPLILGSIASSGS